MKMESSRDDAYDASFLQRIQIYLQLSCKELPIQTLGGFSFCQPLHFFFDIACWLRRRAYLQNMHVCM